MWHAYALIGEGLTAMLKKSLAQFKMRGIELGLQNCEDKRVPNKFSTKD